MKHFQNLEKLKVLIVMNNPIYYLEDDIFSKNILLEELLMNNCILEKIPESFYELRNLKKIKFMMRGDDNEILKMYFDEKNIGDFILNIE
ncbi:hypothetical protein EB155_12180 [archaeon]|nr:hypothetical protein [archaeon]NDB80609.1 hypothetical protein [archaeon]